MGLLSVVTGGAVLMAACGGSAGAPQVASLGKSVGASGASTPAGTSNGDPVRLLNEWTACMRSHGDSDQAVPTIDAGKDVHILTPAGYYGTMDGPSGQDNSGAGVTCQGYLTEVSAALNGGQPPAQPSTAQMDEYARCMRASGIPDYPDPGAPPPGPPDGSGDLNPNNRAFQVASKACAKKTGADLGVGVVPGQIEIYLSNGQLGSVGF